MAGGPTKATVSISPRAWRGTACILRGSRCTGPTSAFSLCTAMDTRACSGIASFLWSGDIQIYLGDAEDARSHCRQHGFERHSVLGHRYRRLRPDAGIHAANCTCGGSSSRRSIRCSARTAAIGDCAFRGAGIRAASDIQETPSYNPDPKELHNAAIEPICKKYLELRYQMMPYLYSAVKETCETGVPIIRALWLHYPRRRGRGGSRRRVPIRPGHPGGPGGGEGRDFAPASICRSGVLVRLLDSRENGRRPRDQRKRGSRNDAASMFAPAR